MMKLAQHIFYGLFLLILVGVGAIFFAPSIPGMPAVEMKIVQSGSMEPGIKTGGVVVLAPATNYHVGDVITYTDTSVTIPTTHRIVDSYMERGQTWFVTKGDANESIDASPVPASAVLGRVAFTVPFVGFVLDFARQPMGFALLIVLPALLIILGEIDKIVREIRGRRQPTTRCPFIPTFHGVQMVPIGYRRQPIRMMDIGVPARTGFGAINTLDLSNCFLQSHEALIAAKRRFSPDWALVLILVVSSSMFAAASFIPYTASYFSDSVVSASNVFRAGFFTAGPPESFVFSVVPENVCIDIKKPQGNNTSTAIPKTFSISDLPEGVPYTVSMVNVLKQDTTTSCTNNFQVRVAGQADATWSSFTLSTTSSSLALDLLYKSNAANDSCSADMVFSATYNSETYSTSIPVVFHVGSPNNPTGLCPATIQTTVVEVEPQLLSIDEEVAVEEVKEVEEIVVETFVIVETETDEEEIEEVEEEIVEELIEEMEDVEVLEIEVEETESEEIVVIEELPSANPETEAVTTE
jgi:signal peptidase I